MRIVERYSTRMRIFLARGGWTLLRPIRDALSLCHGLCRSVRPAGRRARACAVRTRAAGSARVVSVGNLESGGTGKTPCVLALAAELLRRGYRPVVVTRGYGGKAGRQGRPVIAAARERIDGGRADVVFFRDDSDQPGRTAEREKGAVAFLGDEACLYLRKGFSVVIGRDRRRAICAALQTFTPSHILLDDAFHRTEVGKDLDILLLDFERPFGNGRLLPGGTLREPARAALRAGAVVFTRASGRSVPGPALPFVEGKPVFFARHVPAGLIGRGDEPVDPLSLAGRPVAVFSGIARPDSFESLAAQAGLEPCVAIRFDDHRRYTPRDVDFILARAGTGAVLVTTAKDWGRIAALVPTQVQLFRLEMRMEIEGIERLLEPVLA